MSNNSVALFRLGALGAATGALLWLVQRGGKVQSGKRTPNVPKRRVGVVGYGKLGQYLVDAILTHPVASKHLELAFVWNRTSAAMSSSGLPDDLILHNLDNFAGKGADLIVEVAHPCITKDYACRFLEHADYFVGSPTAFADLEVERKVRAAAAGGHAVYIPSGALWGAQDIQKMADAGSITGLRIAMKKHPSSFKVLGSVKAKLDAVSSDAVGEVELYAGPVRDLCPLAPNNVNTMACAALAAHNLGFDGVQAHLIADNKLEAHVITIEITGPVRTEEGTRPFGVSTERYNPAKVGAVTGNLTYASFLSSMLRARGQGTGLHFC